MNKRCAIRVSNNLKDITIVSINRLIKNFIVPGQEGRHRMRMLLCKFRAAFNVGEQECDDARGRHTHKNPLLLKYLSNYFFLFASPRKSNGGLWFNLIRFAPISPTY